MTLIMKFKVLHHNNEVQSLTSCHDLSESNKLQARFDILVWVLIQNFVLKNTLCLPCILEA